MYMQKICECCGKSMRYTRVDKKTCSVACRKALSRGKRRVVKAERTEDVTLTAEQQREFDAWTKELDERIAKRMAQQMT